MILREISNLLEKALTQNKVIILLGPRQVGKTTVLQDLIRDKAHVKWLNGDDFDVRELFKAPTSTNLKSHLGDAKVLVIDEAQKVDNIGLGVKLLYDNHPEIQIIATGSSAFELRNRMNEPLTGRKFEYNMFPFSTQELIAHFGLLEEKRQLHHRLVYGYYPEIVTEKGELKELLRNLVDSYLFKDILMLEGIKKPDKLLSLLQALAFQVGSQVSYHEIGNMIGLNTRTIEAYIDLLEKSYVIFRINSFSRNLRNELKASRKIYFYDNGVRNAIISNYTSAYVREDIGKLWENYLVAERKKFNHYNKNYCNTYFWRNRAQNEVDYIEERDGQLFAFEFKWNPLKKITFHSFSKGYPDAICKVITPDNYLEFVLEKGG